MTLPQMMDTTEAQAGAEWNPNALLLPPDLSYEQWEQVGATLSTMERGVNWWIGDWLNYGERAYGEKYAQAVEETGKRRESLMNLASVSGRIPPEARRPGLSWSAHRAVAYLEPSERDRLLSEAEVNGWGARELADAVKDLSTKAIPRVTPPAEQSHHRGEISDPDNLPARVESLADPDEEQEDDFHDEPDLAAELERADAEIRAQQVLLDSLQSSDAGKEIAGWAQRYAQLEGRLRQAVTEANELKRQASRQGKVLREIRKALGVDSDAEILEALRLRRAA